MTLMFNKCFINDSMTDLITGKIHTIRSNYYFWKKHDGKEVSIRVWSGKPYRSKQIEVCRKVIHVQKIELRQSAIPNFYIENICQDLRLLADNDGFGLLFEFVRWFRNYPDAKMAILHFTDFRY